MFRQSSKSSRVQAHKRLGDILLEDDVISKRQLNEALERQRNEAGFIGQILVEQKALTQDALTNYLVKQCRIPHLNLLDYEIDPEALRQVSEEVCLKYYVLPIDKLGRILTLAMVDPLDSRALKEIQRLTPDLRIKPMLCNWEHYQAVVKRIFNKETQKPDGLDEKYAYLGVAGTASSSGDRREGYSSGLGTIEDDVPHLDSAIEATFVSMPDDVQLKPRERAPKHKPVTPEQPTPGEPGQSPFAAPAVQDIHALADAVRDSIRDAMSDLVDAVARSTGRNTETPDAAQLVGAVQQSLENTINILAEELRQERNVLQAEIKALGASLAETGAAQPETLSDTMHIDTGTVLQEALGNMAEQLREISEAFKTSSHRAPEMSPEFEKTLQKAMGDAARQSAEAMSAQLHSLLMSAERNRDEDTQVDPQAIVEAVRESVGAAMENTLQTLSGEFRTLIEAQQRQIEALPPPPDFNHAAELLREQLGVTLDTAMKGLIEQVRTLVAHGDTQNRRDIESLAEAVRESICTAVGAVQDAHTTQQAELTAMVKTALERIAQYTNVQSEQQQQLAAAVQKTLQAMIERKDAQENDLAGVAEAILRSVENDKTSQSEKQEQLAQIAQAALESVRQTTQLFEAYTVAENNQSDLRRRRQAKHASVAPFANNESNGAVNTALHEEEDSRVREALDADRPLDTLNFDNFFPGETNAFSFKLCRSVSEQPGGEYNPLFLYGKVGTGKTHIISAVGNAVIAGDGKRKDAPPIRVGYISASHFARRLSAAIGDNALELFRDNYCHWDVLILDDIQFLGGRVEAQEEFFHIFNVLLQENRQIIIAADKPPDRLGLLEQRLVSRFASGIVAELKAPEWETRMRILHHLADECAAEVPEEVMGLIAMTVADDVRKMTGALRKIIAFSRFEGGKISMESAQDILSHLGVIEAA